VILDVVNFEYLTTRRLHSLERISIGVAMHHSSHIEIAARGTIFPSRVLPKTHKMQSNFDHSARTVEL